MKIQTMRQIISELSAPAPQSAREVAKSVLPLMTKLRAMHDYSDYSEEFQDNFYGELATLIEAYAESRVQEAVEKAKQESWKWFCGTGREDNFPARYDRLSDSIDIAMREPKP